MLELRITVETPEQMAGLLTKLGAVGGIAPHPGQAPSTPDTDEPANVNIDAADEKQPATEKAQPAPTTTDEPALTVDDIRDALVKINNAQGLDAAKAFMDRFGVVRVSDVPEDRYAEFITAAREQAQ